MDNLGKEKFLNWTDAEAARFGKTPQMNRHRIHELPWFSDEQLVQIIKNHPRIKLRVFTSGSDPTRRNEDCQPVDTEGVSAEEILAAVRVGRMWVNLQRIDAVDPRFGELGKRLYSEIEADCPHFKPLWTNRAFLFISSPNAMVYLHADYQPNMLWHIRGHKRIWIYPAYDERIVSLRRIEEICAAGGEDDIPFKAEFDQMGTFFDPGPGDTVSWPARAPHRVVNGPDLNVSLSTFHETVDDFRRVEEHCADYFFRRTLPIVPQIARGPFAPAKVLAFKLCRRAGLAQHRASVKEYYAKYRVDPSMPLGLRPIPNGPILTEHSRLVKAASAAA